MDFFAGIGLGLGLIVAIGAQNVFVLRQGLRREFVLPVVVICTLSDIILIALGTGGLGFLVQHAPWLVPVARVAGFLFLLVYGILAARRAWQGEDGLVVDDTSARGRSETRGTHTRTATKTRSRLLTVIGTVLAITWLNPHVYLDTVLMLGSIAATHGDAKWIFAAGAMTASLLWFTGLGFGARYLGRWLRTPRAWRILDGAIAVIMIALAFNLLLPVFTG